VQCVLQRQSLELVRRSALRLQKLVNTLLDFSRIEAGRMDARYEPTDLPALTAQLAGMFESAVQRAGLRLAIDCAPASEPAYVDRDMWEKIVLNLVSNAFKFTPEGEIAVALRETADAFVLTVRDTGLGIPAEEMPHLFARFHHVRQPAARTHEGTGIGLALVHELVRLHGGEISATSEPGRGTTFFIRLPRGNRHLPPGHITAARELASARIGATPFVEEALRWLPDQADRPPTTAWTDAVLPAARSARAMPCLGARILVAEDNADMQEYLRSILAPYWSVDVVGDGHAALRAAREFPPELLVSDVMMPGLDGFEVLRAIRSDERTRDIPVILLSARAGEEAAIDALAAGADAYLVKPFSVRELVAYVGGHLQLQRLRRQSQLALAASEAKFAAAFAQSPLALTITSFDDGRLVDVNDGFVRLSGYTREEALGRTVHELRLWREPERHREGIEHLRGGGRIAEAEARLRTKHGEERVGLVGAVMIEIGGRPHILSSVVDVTEQRRATEELATANARLREADRRKDEFLAMLGHELRNPLAAVRNAVATADLDPARRERALGIARRQIEQLGRLIDDLLDVARITQGRIALRTEPVRLSDILDRAIENARALIDSRGVHLDASETVESLVVRGDPTRLEQVFVNLLSNAAKYTDPGGRITVAIARHGDTARISVRDTGIGIAPAMLARMWDLFAQADHSLDRSQGGLGIGLTVARRLVELHGGHIEASSEGIGHGAEFVVTLPALPDRTPQSAARPRDSPDARRPARVLLVEDNVDAAESLSMLLELLGYQVRVAHDGIAGLDAARREPPDVMLVDIGLPGMDGYELARRVRADPRLAHVILIALTGYGREQDRDSALASGFDRHLVKPVSPEALDGLVAELSAGRSAHPDLGSADKPTTVH
jgi:PAS domain S-box-containing protein